MRARYHGNHPSQRERERERERANEESLGAAVAFNKPNRLGVRSCEQKHAALLSLRVDTLIGSSDSVMAIATADEGAF